MVNMPSRGQYQTTPRDILMPIAGTVIQGGPSLKSAHIMQERASPNQRDRENGDRVIAAARIVENRRFVVILFLSGLMLGYFLGCVWSARCFRKDAEAAVKHLP